jgi:hypothetical protein
LACSSVLNPWRRSFSIWTPIPVRS